MAEPHQDQELRRRAPKKLVLCFDGTGNKFHGDESDSNILKIFRMLDRTADDQYNYYQPGIGTYVVSNSLSHTSVKSRLKSWYMKAKDSAVGSSFDQHVVGGYRFLMRYYSTGADIFIFGFSRGAYIARFLAEMLDYVGLLSHGNEEMVVFAWKAFSQWQCRQSTGDDDDGKARQKKLEMYNFMKGFRETFSRPVKCIRFLGLFDTVNSVPRFETAWMERSKFPYTARSSAKVIRHAVSIDERRAKFRQDLMYQKGQKSRRPRTEDSGHMSCFRHNHGNNGADQELGEFHETYRHRPSVATTLRTNTTDATRAASEIDDRDRRTRHEKLSIPSIGDEPTPFRARSRSRSCATHATASQHSSVAPFQDDEDDSEQDIDEVWFAGGHGDVGGGWPVEEGRRSTSHIPLVWMVREAMKAGIIFDMEKVIAMGCSEALDESGGRDNDRDGPVTVVPAITVQVASPPCSPHEKDMPQAQDFGNSFAAPADAKEQQMSSFHKMLHKAHCSRIHDSLSFDCGMSAATVFSWKVMEYMPFRRMDLQADGTWNPIRWPLPCGEVRDIPDDVRVHGSVIRRMREDKLYRPGNLIMKGGGRGRRMAKEEYGMGEWECVESPGDPVSEIFKKRS